MNTSIMPESVTSKIPLADFQWLLKATLLVDHFPSQRQKEKHWDEWIKKM